VLPGTPMPALLQINDCLPFLSLTKFKWCMNKQSIF
jgi:hypothetical protein